MGKLTDLLARAGRRALGAAGGPIDWWTMWYRMQTGHPWAHLGWFALSGAYKPNMGDYNCDFLRLVRPGDVGRSDLNHWCPPSDRYEALLPGRMNAPLGAAKYWWVYGRSIAAPGWQFDGWLWANPAVVADLRALPSLSYGTEIYIGG